jgi:hypothetical protein
MGLASKKLTKQTGEIPTIVSGSGHEEDEWEEYSRRTIREKVRRTSQKMFISNVGRAELSQGIAVFDTSYVDTADLTSHRGSQPRHQRYVSWSECLI